MLFLTRLPTPQDGVENRDKVYSFVTQGPVVRRTISANPGLNFNLGFFFFCSKAFSRIIFSILFIASNHQFVGKKNKTDFLFKLSYLNSNFALTLGYLNPALNNPAQIVISGIRIVSYVSERHMLYVYLTCE